MENSGAARARGIYLKSARTTFLPPESQNASTREGHFGGEYEPRTTCDLGVEERGPTHTCLCAWPHARHSVSVIAQGTVDGEAAMQEPEPAPRALVQSRATTSDLMTSTSAVRLEFDTVSTAAQGLSSLVQVPLLHRQCAQPSMGLVLPVKRNGSALW